MCEDVVWRVLYYVQFIPDNLSTQNKCEKVVEINPWALIDVQKHLKTKDMCERVVEKTPCLLWFVPDCFKTKKICEKVVGERLGLLRDVSDWIITQQQLRIWCDNIKYNHCNDNELSKSYKRFQKRKAQKASIKGQILSIAWDP